MGDVTSPEDDIDGINMASRLWAKAQPGQVVASDLLHHSLEPKQVPSFQVLTPANPTLLVNPCSFGTGQHFRPPPVPRDPPNQSRLLANQKSLQ